MSKTLSNTVYYLAQALVANIVPFLILPVLTRFLTPAEYGVIGLSAAFALSISGFVHLGMTLAYQRNYFHYRKDKQEEASLLYTTILFVMVNAVVAVAIVWFFKDSFSWVVFAGKKEFGQVLLTDFIATHLIGVTQYFFLYFQNAAQAKNSLKFTFIQTIANMILSLVFVCLYQFGLMGVIYAKLFAALITLVVMVGYFLKQLPWQINLSLIWVNLKLSLPLTLRFFTKPIAANFDKWLVNMLGSLNAAGVYAMGQKFANVGFTAMTALDQVYVPKTLGWMTEDKERKRRQEIADFLMPFCYFSFLFCLLICFFAQEIIMIALPASFHGAIPIVGILSLYYGCMFFGKLPQFLYAGKTLYISALSFLNLILMAGFCWMLVPKMGAMGAALGLLIAEMFTEAITFYAKQREYDIAWPKGSLLILILMFLGFGLSVVICQYGGMAYLEVLTLKLSLLAVYVIIGICLKLWSPKTVITLIQRKLGRNV